MLVRHVPALPRGVGLRVRDLAGEGLLLVGDTLSIAASRTPAWRSRFATIGALASR